MIWARSPGYLPLASATILVASLCTCTLWGPLLCLNLVIQPLLAFRLFFCKFLTFSAFTELKRVKAVLWKRLCLEGMLGLIWGSIQVTKKRLPISKKSVLFFYYHMYVGGAVLIFFKNSLFAFAAWLPIWCKNRSSKPISAFGMPSSLVFIIT